MLIIMLPIIDGHSLRRACLQPTMNMLNSKPRPPTADAERKGKNLKTKLHTTSTSATDDHPPPPTPVQG